MAQLESVAQFCQLLPSYFERPTICDGSSRRSQSRRITVRHLFELPPHGSEYAPDCDLELCSQGDAAIDLVCYAVRTSAL
jgi:hypothetical protein